MVIDCKLVVMVSVVETMVVDGTVVVSRRFSVDEELSVIGRERSVVIVSVLVVTGRVVLSSGDIDVDERVVTFEGGLVVCCDVALKGVAVVIESDGKVVVCSAIEN